MVNPPGGKLVIAGSSFALLRLPVFMFMFPKSAPHQLHWITLSQTYDIIEHEITDLSCSSESAPCGYISVDNNGQVLVTTGGFIKAEIRTTSDGGVQSTKSVLVDIPARLLIYDKDSHRQLRVIDLPRMLRLPTSVNSAPGVFTVVGEDSNEVVCLDSKGQVLRTYGHTKDFSHTGWNFLRHLRRESKFHPHHVVGHAGGYLLISDCENHRLHLLNSNGTFLRYLLCRDRDHIKSPTAISLDEQAGLLAVSCRDDNSVMIFSLRLLSWLYTQNGLKVC